MNKSYRKAALVLAAAIIGISALSGCANGTKPSPTAAPSAAPTAMPTPKAFGYSDVQYGFELALPDSWKGFTVVNSTWEGLPVKTDGKAVTGPMLSVRHPKWTKESPRQDIPVMVFTLAQWDAMKNGEYHIGAAPIDPTELGRNNKYVFALPARYNFSFFEGYEEVETILKGAPLKATDIK